MPSRALKRFGIVVLSLLVFPSEWSMVTLRFTLPPVQVNMIKDDGHVLHFVNPKGIVFCVGHTLF